MSNSQMEQKIEYILQNKEISSLLLQQDLRLFIKYTHYAINNSEFIFKKFHLDIIQKLQDIAFNKNEKRNLAISVPVGSGKSLIVEYFIAWTKCRDKNVMDCYISHSTPNITKLSREVKSMFEHEFLQTLYGLQLKKDERAKINWSFEGAYNRSGLRAASMGTGFTGADAGNPNVQGYSGALIVDDPMDAEHIKSELKRKDVIERYKAKLETRRRTTTTPSIVIMQRLHKEDLIGYLQANEPHLWDFVKIQAIDEEACSFWPERYPLTDLLLIKEKNPFLFYSQYQQEPQMLDGTYVKREYLQYEPHNVILQRNYDAIYISCDTANKDKAINDPSALLVFGVYQNNFYLIDLVNQRMLFPELLRTLQQLISKYNPRSLLIEDKASGTQAIQFLKANGLNNTNIIPLSATQGKEVRLNASLESIQAGRLIIPADAKWTFDYVQQLISFPNDKHDDMCFIAGTLVATKRGQIPIEEITINDFVLTPFGFYKVLQCGITGTSKTISNSGLIGTPQHKILTFNNDFIELQYITKQDNLSYLNLWCMIKTTLLKLLNSMELNIDEWEEIDNITCLKPQQTLEGKILKACMLQFMNFITTQQYQKGMMFIIKMAIHLITALRTWSVFQGMNMLRQKTLEVKKYYSILTKLDPLQLLGIKVKQVERGTKSMQKKQNKGKLRLYAKCVMQIFLQREAIHTTVVENARQVSIEQRQKVEIVYNIKVDKIPLYYANNILVHNCDATSHFINWYNERNRKTQHLSNMIDKLTQI